MNLINIDFKKMREFCEDNYYKCFTDGNIDSGRIMGFEYQGMHIINPFITECGRFNVNPVDYYGEAFLQSEFCIKFKILK